MKLEPLHIEPVCHRFRIAAGTGRGVIPPRTGFAVELRTADGVVGRGEALPLPQAGTEDVSRTSAALQEAAAGIGLDWLGLEDFLGRLDEILASAPAARCGLDNAAYDLAWRLARGPESRRRPDPAHHVEVNGIVFAGDVDSAVEAARACTARGYSTLKLKLDGRSSAEDERRVRAVRQAIGPAFRLRLDANAAWSADQALDRIAALVPYDIEFLEQPVAASDLDALARVAARSPIPIAADEVLATASGREAAASGITPLIILKPMVLGGLQPALALARRAAARGVECVVTTTFDGPPATAAALALAAAVGGSGRAHGLSAADVLETAFPAGLVPHRGRLEVSADLLCGTRRVP